MVDRDADLNARDHVRFTPCPWARISGYFNATPLLQAPVRLFLTRRSPSQARRRVAAGVLICQPPARHRRRRPVKHIKRSRRQKFRMRFPPLPSPSPPQRDSQPPLPHPPDPTKESQTPPPPQGNRIYNAHTRVTTNRLSRRTGNRGRFPSSNLIWVRRNGPSGTSACVPGVS